MEKTKIRIYCETCEKLRIALTGVSNVRMALCPTHCEHIPCRIVKTQKLNGSENTACLDDLLSYREYCSDFPTSTIKVLIDDKWEWLDNI